VRAAALFICLGTLALAAIIVSAIHSSAVSITMKEPLGFSDLESISAGTRLPIFPPKGPLPAPVAHSSSSPAAYPFPPASDPSLANRIPSLLIPASGLREGAPSWSAK